MPGSKDTITPCPLSRNYRIPRDQAWRSLRVYLIYRMVFATILMTLCFSGLASSVYSKYNPQLFTLVSSVYFIITGIASVLVVTKKPGYSFQAQLHVFLDIIAVTLLMHTGGGIDNGLGILLVVTVAAGGILIGGKCALFFAALASLAILGDQLYSDLTESRFLVSYSYAGYLGISFFTVALLAHTLARRAELSQAIADKQGIDLANLQQLNAYILQHLDSGIIVVDREKKIRMITQSASKLLENPVTHPQFTDLPHILIQEFNDWLTTPLSDYATLQINDDEWEARFTQLGGIEQPFYMISLEESRLVNQRVQQKKLASLGRLTASIAHEIRNPLGALSHAAQLLAESPAIDKSDLRLADIIQHNSQRINIIIEEILQLSKRKKSHRIPIDLERWLTNFATDFSAEQQLPNNPFEFDFPDESVIVMIDPGQLKQMVDNLCINALKHGNRDNLVIRLRIGNRPEDNTARLEVIDNGFGIKTGKVSQLFEPFFTTSNSGTGLGLYVVKELAELNQSQIEYCPEKEGSCFRLILPNAETTIVEL